MNNKHKKTSFYSKWGMSGLFLATAVHAGTPVWTYSAPNPVSVTVSSDSTATIQYTVTNQSSKPKNLKLKPTAGLSAPSCHLAGKGSTCTLVLTVKGSSVPSGGIHAGPVLCEESNPNQCYQPSVANQLHIVKESSVLVALSLSGSPLTLTVGGSSDTMVITNMSVTTTALNIAADFNGTALAGHVSQDASQCVNLLPGHSCTLIFTPDTTAITQVSFPIKGSNTQQVSGVIGVVQSTQASISVSGSPLTLTAGGSAGSLTVTNQSTILTATDISASLEGTALENNVIQDASDCMSVLPSGSCTLTFTPGTTAVSATTIMVHGSNTSQSTASIAINATPQAPIRITGGQSMTLYTNDVNAVGWMVVKNNSATLTATNIAADFRGTSLSGHITQDASDCISVAPNTNCTLRFTASGTTDVSATNFGVSGRNTTQATGTLAIDTLTAPSIKDSSQGGIAACTTSSNMTASTLYLVAATSDNNTGIQWGGDGTLIGLTNLIDGYSNTNAIVNTLTSVAAPYAAKICYTYQIDENGNAPCRYGVCYEGWYLPSRYELLCLYNNAIGGSDYYWSSTENDESSAWNQYFINGEQRAYPKDYTYRVRCVRAITK